MKLNLLLVLVLLAGCDRLAVEPITPTRDDRTFTLTVDVIPEDEIVKHCSRLGVKYDANGCAAFNHDTKHCTIYVVAPRHVDDAERFSVIGHETWHCRFGEWHQ
jgi:hypothetical protein